MNGVLTHTRDIYCILTRQKLIYRIPIYFSPELDYLRTPFLQLEIDTSKQKEVIITKENELKSYIEMCRLRVEEGCCPRK